MSVQLPASFSGKKVAELLKAKGAGSLLEELCASAEVHIKRAHVKKIKARLMHDGLVVLRRRKRNPAHFEFVSPTKVTITENRGFANKRVLEKALKVRARKQLLNAV